MAGGGGGCPRGRPGGRSGGRQAGRQAGDEASNTKACRIIVLFVSVVLVEILVLVGLGCYNIQ